MAEAKTQFRTDDVRIKEIKELVPPSHVLREFPVSDKAGKTVYETRQAIHRILHGADDRLLVIIGPCSIHDVKAAKEYAGRLKREKDRLADDLLVVMRVYFEKPRTTVGWKGLINDPQPRRQLPHQRGPAHRARAAARPRRDGHAGRLRVPRHDHAAVHRRPRVLGRHRRAHHRVADPPRAGVGAVLPGRLQERHRRQRQDRRGRDPRGAGAAPFPVGHQGRALRDRLHRRQRGLPRHPARRQQAELRRGERRRRREDARRRPASPRGS